MQSVAFSLTITLCLALAAAGLAFVAGRAAADPEARYEQGIEEGERIGRSQARSEVAPGTDAYLAIFDRGRARGVRDGRAEGRRAGRRLATTAARDEVFRRFGARWEIGDWYLINLRPGDDGARYAIGARIRVKPGTSYHICKKSYICRRSR